MRRFCRPIPAAALVLAASPVAAATAGPDPFFASDSPFNRTVPVRAPIDGASPRVAQALLSTGQGININTGAWTPTVFYATKSSPVRTIQISNGSRLQIPMPPEAVASSDSDGPMEIIDRSRRCVYDFSQATRAADGSWTASGAAVFRLDGTGIHRPWAIRASGFSLGAGLIRPAEVRAGVIKHALLVALPMTSPAFVSPATTSDGHDPNGVPMGSHLQLDPRFDVTQLPRGQRLIARAMQRYGVYVGDTSSAITLFAQNASSVAGFRYPASWSSGLSHAREILASLRLLSPRAAPRIDASPLRPCG
jgi:hypothetical protein